MEIKVMGFRKALAHTPLVPTLAMRIFDSDADPIIKRPLVCSPFYKIYCYTFDDLDMDIIHALYPNDKSYLRRVHFSEDIAKQILTDFENSRQGMLELLVHCTLGANRSPAVAIALNEIFGLGHNTDEMKTKYSAFNRYVYRLMKEAA
ncbi:MAG: hypothetical protein KJ955_01800 [Nanoarchaeota archaeon]|nr:hypothetical protein [Nanoarchaeota archaeon]